MVEFADEAAERSAGGDHGVSGAVERADAFVRHAGRQHGGRARFVRAELADERAVDGVRGAVDGGHHVQVQVVALDPRCIAFVVHDAAFALEMADFGERQAHAKRVFVGPLHRDVVPVLPDRVQPAFGLKDDLVAVDGCVSDVGAEERASGDRFGAGELEFDGIPAEPLQVFSGLGVLRQFRHTRFFRLPPPGGVFIRSRRLSSSGRP